MMKSIGYMPDILGVLISFSLHILNICEECVVDIKPIIFVSVSSPNEGLTQCLSS